MSVIARLKILKKKYMWQRCVKSMRGGIEHCINIAPSPPPSQLYFWFGVYNLDCTPVFEKKLLFTFVVENSHD